MNRGLKAVRHRRDDALSRVKWDRLEGMVADHYRSRGYDVEHCGTGGTRSRFDGGIDLRLRKDGETLLVQCKHWNAYKVAHNDVHQLLGLVVNEEAAGGILITSGEFTKAAIEAAARQGRIQLIDGDELRQMIGPLPDEPTRTPMDMRLSATVTSAAGAFTANAAERLVAAAEDRIRSGGGVRRSVARAGADALLIVLLKIAMAGVLLILLLFGFNKVLQGFAASVVVRPGPQPAANPRLESPALPAAQLPVTQPTPVQGSTPARGTAQVGSSMMEADLREWRRRNAESMKILEATTRELPHRPTAADAQ